MQLDIASQNEAGRLIFARRHNDASAALHRRSIDRALNRVAAEFSALCAKIQNVHQPKSSPFSMAAI